MAVGLSDGTSHADTEEYNANLAKVYITGSSSDNDSSTPSTMPLGASTEPAGALNQAEGTQPPGNSDKVEFTTSSPLINITSGDIDTAINVGLSAGPGTMAGVRSAAIKGKLSDLGHAQVLESNNVHPDEIWSKTGFMRGADSRWRYEINDAASKFNDKWHELPEGLKGQEKDMMVTEKLSSILDHPELYKAYPALKDIKVVRDPGYAAEGARYEAGSGPGKLTGAQIRMGTEAAKDQGTLMHEVQHAIQGYEGFAKGGAPMSAPEQYGLKLSKAYDEWKDWAKGRWAEINQKYKDKGAMGLTDKDFSDIKYLGEVPGKFKEYVKAAADEASELYKRLAGETESRNVETRLLLNEAERRKISPTWTEDTARSQQIIREEPTWTTAYGILDKGRYVKP